MPVHQSLIAVAALFVGASALFAQTARVPATDRSATPLDRYVAAPDPAYSWSTLETRQEGPVTVTVLGMTSQSWLTKKEVSEPLWRHHLVVIRPAEVTSDTSLLFISGGSNDRDTLPKTNAMLAQIAVRTGTVVTELRMVPNQPLTFFDDGAARKEDDLIAFGWRRFIDGDDDIWLARLPMTKAAVRAMDTIQAFAQTPEGGRRAITKFVVSGASKRGWTTWTTAAVDSRVVAIAPLVIDLLNVRPSFVHHWRAYGAWAPAVGDYQTHGIMDRMDDPRFARLLEITEPYSYRDRLNIPKYVVNATGDQFFLPDSWQFYWSDLRGESLLRYVPNTDHSLDGSDAPQGLLAFYDTIVRGLARPRFEWNAGTDGSLEGRLPAGACRTPATARLWTASNPTARDFRLEVIGAVWTATDLRADAAGVFRARLTTPASGWTAGFIEVRCDVGAAAPLLFSTGVRVVPDTLPFPAPGGRR